MKITGGKSREMRNTEAGAMSLMRRMRMMAPMEVPLMSKWAASARHAPLGQKSVMTTIAGWPEQAELVVHLTCITRGT